MELDKSSMLAAQRRVWVLAMIPVAVAALPPLLRLVLGPYYLSLDFDPDYQYLMNGLNVLRLRSPDHTDHPGTPVQVLAGFVTGIGWLTGLVFSSKSSLQQSVLTNPEHYLILINSTFGVFNGLALYVLGTKLYKESGAVIVALIAQLSILLSVGAVHAFTRVSPEPLLVASTLLLASLLVPFVFGQPDHARPYEAEAIGGVLGLGLAIKVTTLPLFACIALLPSWGARLRALAASIVALIFFTLPIAKHYGRTFWWFQSVASKQSRELGVDASNQGLERLVGRLGQLAASEPALFVCLGLSLILVLVLTPSRRRPGLAGFYRLLLVGVLVSGAQVALVATTPLPEARYLLPAVTFLGLVNAGIAGLALRAVDAGPRAVWPFVLVIAPMLAGVFHSVYEVASWLASASRFRMATAALDRQLTSSDCTIIYYYGAPNLAFDLQFGIEWADPRYRSQLEQLYPSLLTYNPWGGYHTVPNRFAIAGRYLDNSKIRNILSRSSCVDLVGRPVKNYAGTPIQRLPLDKVTTGLEPSLAKKVEVYRLRRDSKGEYDLDEH